MTLLQKLAIVYAFGFFGIVLLGYIPGATDDQGLLLGAFKIDPVDDVLHLFSGLWALIAGIKSRNAAQFYFRAFGIFYTSDAFLGFFSGYSYMDFLTQNWNANEGYSLSNIGENIAVNLPHFILGPLAVYIGFSTKKGKPAKKS